MGIFGLTSSKKAEEEKRRAAEQAAEQAARQVVQNNMTNLSNLSRGSQVKFAVPCLTRGSWIKEYRYRFTA